MNSPFKYALWLVIAFCAIAVKGQNENRKWYFGSNSGLDFMTSPPTVLSNGAMTSPEGCSAISDAKGNILFYTNGITIWNRQHQVMANGTALMGHPSASQSGLVLKQPGNNPFYLVFTLDAAAGSNGLRYSVVNMSQAAGMGSVTVKNTLLNSPSTEKLTATRDCNGVDYWLVSHDWQSASFRAYRVTASGVNTVAVLSNVGTPQGGSNVQNAVGCMKLSPNGKKIGMVISNSPYDRAELFDFDNATGTVSNPIILITNLGFIYGCEFSPNSSKFYVSSAGKDLIYQWDLCAGSETGISASQYTLSTPFPFGMQLAPNGRIYVTEPGKTALSVISHPDEAGPACSFSAYEQPISGLSTIGLPNFIALRPATPPFACAVTGGTNQSTCSFSLPWLPNTSVSACTISGYSLTGLRWDFGDSLSGPHNSSYAFNPSHVYHCNRTYTVTLILYFSCGGGTDTLRQAVTINHPQTVPQVKVLPGNTVCINDTLSFEGSGGGNCVWNGPNRFERMGPRAIFPVDTLSVAGTYTLSFGGNYGCNIVTSFNIAVKDIPHITITGGKFSGCVPYCAGFSYKGDKSQAYYDVTWSGEQRTVPGHSFSCCFNKPDTYILSGHFISTQNQCAVTSTFAVEVYPLPQAGFTWSPTKLIEGDEPVHFYNTSVSQFSAAYNWLFDTGDSSLSQTKHPSFIFASSGAYPVSLKVQNMWGCVDSITRQVVVEPDFSAFVPNIFTPDNNGLNEEFLPVTRAVKRYQLMVFNRWGQKIFETDSQATGWDGRLNGELCPPGVYTWKMSLTRSDGIAKELAGHVLLQR